MKLNKILYIRHTNNSFSTKDISILQKNYDVSIFFFPYDPIWKTPLIFIKEIFFILQNINKCDKIVCQFAGYHSVIPAYFANLFNKKMILILGGTDCFSFPSIDYGNYRKKLLAWATIFSIKNSSKIFPVHQNLIFSKNDYYVNEKDPPYQGFEYFCGKVKADIEVINYGYDSELFKNIAEEKKANSFITVGYKLEGNGFYRKGIDLILEVAALFPECTFTILGCETPELFKDSPNNVHLIPPVKYEELTYYYSQHEFYFQLSITEGFPSAICEAMLCECIPIGSDIAAIPEIIGNTGFVLKKRNLKDLKEIINLALKSNREELSKKARERIKSRWWKTYREENLIKQLEK